MSAKTCAYKNCNGPIDSGNPRATYCRRKCKELARQQRLQQAARDARAKQPLICGGCGAEFERNLAGPARKLCSSCNPNPISCALCGKQCRPSPGQIHCVACRQELGVLAADEPLEDVAGCEGCGEPFVQKARRSRFCSDRCSSTGYRLWDRATWHMRRAAEYGADAEKFLSVEIFERDDWTCKICGIPVMRGATVPHPFAPTLDHIEALVNGGHHTRENTQLAHFYCNSIKRDAADPEGRLGVSMPELV